MGTQGTHRLLGMRRTPMQGAAAVHRRCTTAPSHPWHANGRARPTGQVRRQCTTNPPHRPVSSCRHHSGAGTPPTPPRTPLPFLPAPLSRAPPRPSVAAPCIAPCRASYASTALSQSPLPQQSSTVASATAARSASTPAPGTGTAAGAATMAAAGTAAGTEAAAGGVPVGTSLTITRPDDWHLHLRDGAAMACVLPLR